MLNQLKSLHTWITRSPACMLCTKPCQRPAGKKKSFNRRDWLNSVTAPNWGRINMVLHMRCLQMCLHLCDVTTTMGKYRYDATKPHKSNTATALPPGTTQHLVETASFYMSIEGIALWDFMMHSWKYGPWDFAVTFEHSDLHWLVQWHLKFLVCWTTEIVSQWTFRWNPHHEAIDQSDVSNPMLPWILSRLLLIPPSRVWVEFLRNITSPEQQGTQFFASLVVTKGFDDTKKKTNQNSWVGSEFHFVSCVRQPPAHALS